MRRFWPPTDATQADYEALRAAVLAGTPLADGRALRFARSGMLALVARPVAEAAYVAIIHGAPRPPWVGYDDPRTRALAAGYGLLLASARSGLAVDGDWHATVGREG